MSKTTNNQQFEKDIDILLKYIMNDNGAEFPFFKILNDISYYILNYNIDKFILFDMIQSLKFVYKQYEITPSLKSYQSDVLFDKIFEFAKTKLKNKIYIVI